MPDGARLMPLVGVLTLLSCCAGGGAGDHAASARTPESPRTEVLAVSARLTPREPWTARDTLVLADPPDPPAAALTRFGGVDPQPAHATGFFHVARDAAGRFQLTDPDGGSFLSIGVNAVRPNDTARAHDAMRRRFGDKPAWARHTAKLLRDHGFNTLGAWSYWQSIHDAGPPLPYTLQLHLAARFAHSRGQASQGQGHRDFADDLLPVFDPDFPAFCHDQAGRLRDRRDDPWLLGVFSDNELPFPDDALDRCLARPPTDPAHAAALQWRAARTTTTTTATAGTDRSLAAPITAAERAAFLEHVADRYFAIAAAALRAAAPRHLYLGARFHGRVLRSEPVFRAAGRHVDVLSVNWYGRWTPQPTLMDRWLQWTGRPFLISEFYARGDDAGLANTSGAGWTVPTQADRGRFYQHFTLHLLRHRGCVGWHWFRYLDNDPADVLLDPTNLDSNKGLVDAAFEPYPDLLDAMRRLNQRAYSLRAAAPSSSP